MAFVSFRNVRGLIVSLPFLKFMIADLATPDWRERRLVENCFACVRIWSRYFGSTTLSYSRQVSSAGSKVPASGIMDRSTPPAHRARNGRRCWHLLPDIKSEPTSGLHANDNQDHALAAFHPTPSPKQMQTLVQMCRNRCGCGGDLICNNPFMCGRYRLSRRKQIIEEHFDTISGDEDWTPRYNVAPTQPVPIIRQHPKEPRREAISSPLGSHPFMGEGRVWRRRND